MDGLITEGPLADCVDQIIEHEEISRALFSCPGQLHKP